MTTTLSPVFFDAAQAVTMASIELVDYINSERKQDAERAGVAFPSKGFAKLQHKDFLAKVPEVLGAATSAKFSADLPDSYGRLQPAYRLPKREACLMAMSYSYDLQAKVFDKMTALEKQAAPASAPALTPATERATIAMMVAESAARILRIEGVPLLSYITDVAEQFSPEAARALPSYGANRPAGSAVSANSELTRSLTDLLKIHGIDSSARKTNPLLIAAGILEQKTRPSSKGGTKEFLSITAHGLKYGINQTAKQNQLETSPRFFESRFPAMMTEIGQAI